MSFGMARARVLRLARSRAARDLLITFGGRSIQMVLGLAGNVLSARALGPGDFGRFGLVIAVVTIWGTLADAGLAYTTVKFIAQHREQNPGQAQAAARAFWWLRLGTGCGATLLGLLLAAPLARLVLGYADLTLLLQVSFLTLLSLAISSYPDAVQVGLAQFGRLGMAGVANAVITVGGIGLLWAGGWLNLTNLINWNVVLPVVSTLPAWCLLPREWLPWRLRAAPPAATGPAMREIVRFSRWMLLSNLGSIVATKLDLILLGRLASPASAGVYSVALTLAFRLDTLNQSLILVLLPRANQLAGLGAIRRYARRVGAGATGLAVLVGIGALLAQPVIAFLYGARYGAAADLFLALLPAVLFDLATSSLCLLAFPLNRPAVLAVADWLRAGTLLGAGGLLIPPYAAGGAAIARFLSRVAGAAYTFWALRRAARTAPGALELEGRASAPPALQL